MESSARTPLLVEPYQCTAVVADERSAIPWTGGEGCVQQCGSDASGVVASFSSVSGSRSGLASARSAGASTFRRVRTWIVFVLCGVSWGCALFLISKCLQAGLDPLSVAAARCSISATALAVALAVRCAWPTLPVEERQRYRRELIDTLTDRAAMAQMVVLGLLFSALVSTLVAVSEEHVSSGVAGILLMLEPLLTPLLTHIFLPKHLLADQPPLTRVALVGCALGAAGTVVASLPTVARGSTQAAALLVSAGASLVFAAATVLSQWFASRRPALHRATGQMMSGAVLLTVLATVWRASKGQPWSALPQLDAAGWGWLVALGLGPTTLAWALYYELMQADCLGAQAAAVNFLLPPVAIVLGATANDEWTNVGWADRAQELAGLAMVLVGVAVVLRQSTTRASAGPAVEEVAAVGFPTLVSATSS